ncbi:MAG: secretin N-terminal domain-containing protein [Planctomycetota bacterium]
MTTAQAQSPQILRIVGEAKPIESAGNVKGQIVRSRPRILQVTDKNSVKRSATDSVLHKKNQTGSVLLQHRQPRVAQVDITRPELLASGSLSDSQIDVDSPHSNRPRSVEDALETRGSVTFRKTPLSDVVFMLSDLWHINIVAGENVTGEVSGAFHDAPLKEVLSAALTAGGYGYRKTGNSLIVLPVEEIGTDDPSFVTETIRIPVSLQNDESAQQAAQLLLSERGRLQKVGESGLLVMDSAPRVARIRQLFQEISSDQPAATGAATPMAADTITQSGIAYFSPQYTSAEEMAEPLQLALGDQVIVASYPTENRIMIKGNANDLRLASEAVRQLDQPRAQVRITAMIYDVALSELERLGINWGRDLRVNAAVENPALENLTGTVSELFRFNSDLATSGATSIGIGTIQETVAAGAFLEALDTTTEAKLLADPSITVGDRRQASIRIVRRIPIVGSNPIEGSNAVFTQTEFEEAGVVLQVLPRISQDGTIELQVQPEYSVVAELTSTGPVIDSRTADTTVRVADGQMFVLGGLRQKSIVETNRGIPYLQDVKYVGKLFRSHDTEIRESELVVFLKPEIITPCYTGKPREFTASSFAEQQLDRIPHAEEGPMLIRSHDPHCLNPINRQPRPRANGGSESLMYSSRGYESSAPLYEAPSTEHLQPSQHPSRATEPAPQEDAPTPFSVQVSIKEVLPPVHIDPRGMRNR